MIKLGIISDTHRKSADEKIKKIYDRYLKDVDAIVHAGDITSVEVLDAFKDKKVYAVHGNMDDARTQEVLPEKLVFEVGGYRIGVLHGWGSPMGFPEKLLKLFEGEKLNCLIYGHTHIPKKKFLEGNLLTLNPGALFPGLFNRKGSLAYLYIEKEKIEAEIVEVEER